MVAETFLKGQDIENNINAVDHVDGDCANDSIRNLEWVTHMENTRRAGKQGRMKKGLDERGENSPSHVYTEAQIRMACELKLLGTPHKEISEKTGINFTYLDKIFSGYNWTHVTSEYDLKLKKHRKYPEGLKQRIIELSKEGFSITEIQEIVEREFDIELTYQYVKDAKRIRSRKK